MNGASRFFEIFIENLNSLNIISKLKKQFMLKYFKLENYTGNQQLQESTIKLPESLQKSLKDHHFVAVEDIIDSGHSMVKLLAAVSKCGVLSSKCVRCLYKVSIFILLVMKFQIDG
ncbi:hypothetical protein HZS_5634 [Henneguya salminicola]|nr:hypothetical protein HZS_5634 [Henneguya salminicola]